MFDVLLRRTQNVYAALTSHINRMVTYMIRLTTYSIRQTLVALVTTALLATSAGSAIAAPIAVRVSTPAIAPVSVQIKQPTSSIVPGTTLSLQIDTQMTHRAKYFEVRIRVYRPSGQLLYQKTEIRNDVKAGTVSIPFSRDLSKVGSRPGRYPVEVRVLASGTAATTVRSRVLVSDPTLKPMSTAVVVRVSSSPALDTLGRFALDPATHDSERAFVDGLVDLANARTSSITLAIAPITLDEWQRASKGYRAVDTAGVVTVDSESEVSKRYAATLAKLSAAVKAGRIELLDIPYAEPDLGNLQGINALDDLERHYTLGAAVYKQVLDVTPSTGTALNGDIVCKDALPIMTASDVGYVVCSPDSIAASATAGVYSTGANSPKALVIDPALSSLAVTGTVEDILDYEFDNALQDGRPSALTILLNAGPGRSTSLATVKRLFSAVDSASWLEDVSAARAAQLPSQSDVSLVSKAPVKGDAPAGYWSNVAQARRYALALLDAWGTKNTVANSTLNAVLTAESSTWAGLDGSYPFAERGQAFATSAMRYAKTVFDGISVEMRDVTLAGRSGDVPVTISSKTGDPLTVHILTSTTHSSPHSSETTEVLREADNFLTIPVDLGKQVADHLTLQIIAGDMVIATRTVNLKASYLDRLTLVAMVVLVLFGLLIFIRRRVMKADAAAADTDSMQSDTTTPDLT